MAQTVSPTRVILWMSSDGPQIRIQTTGEDFDAVKSDLKELRDRFSEEIDLGPSKCPFSPVKREG